MKGKRIVLGITGSIAAYKACLIIRGLVKKGAEVQVVITPAGKEFITPITLSALTHNPIISDFFSQRDGTWHSHVDLGLWADAMLIAPCTASSLGKMANGIADNMLITTYLSMKAPVFIAPAMDLDMYRHASTQRNMTQLRADGVHIIEPQSGELASGLVGKGRMAEPQDIVREVEAMFDEKKKSLQGKHFLVTAGATIEPIDPVRFISNHSSGKMGYAVAEALAQRGAKVSLVSGRTALGVPAGVERIDVLSAEQMYDACCRLWAEADGAVMCAAVADYTPAVVADQKIKKGDGDMSIALKRTHDIAATLGENKGSRLLVGFAMETENEMANAESKLQRKNMDFIVLNSLRQEGAGFRGDTNVVSIIDSESRVDLPLMSKREVADRIVDKMESVLVEKN